MAVIVNIYQEPTVLCQALCSGKCIKEIMEITGMTEKVESIEKLAPRTDLQGIPIYSL